jgi:hypothetical protein
MTPPRNGGGWVRNDDRCSAEFDLKVEVFRNGVLLTSGERRFVELHGDREPVSLTRTV